jgi:hypothetical protein
MGFLPRFQSCINFDQILVGLHFGANFFFTNSSGTDVMILKIFSPKKIAKKLAFLTHNKAKLCQNFDHNISL